jgi:hypothetical protein
MMAFDRGGAFLPKRTTGAIGENAKVEPSSFRGSGLLVFNRLPTEGYTQGGKFWVRRCRDQKLEGARNTRLLDRFGSHGA